MFERSRAGTQDCANVREAAKHCCPGDKLQSPIVNLHSAIVLRGHSSVGRAPALQAGSQGFESPCLQSTLAAIAKSVDCRAVALAKADLRPCGRERGELRLGKPTMRNAKFFYIYILQSELHADRFYTGLTDDLCKRMSNHNAGRVRHTAKWRPWRLKAYVAISNRLRAAEFEHYLKSASGRAFARKRL